MSVCAEAPKRTIAPSLMTTQGGCGGMMISSDGENGTDGKLGAEDQNSSSFSFSPETLRIPIILEAQKQNKRKRPNSFYYFSESDTPDRLYARIQDWTFPLIDRFNKQL
ncbi:hypothetical protein TWF730_011103 [Orbilia blumenaviensis]|uniref:Ycf15 n=1 Tax=Orbilia blumenaviensis TaxID=1796055 RepID=A0AAV9UKV7_9PEZI